MSKQYLTKLHNELTSKNIQHEYIQKSYLTCINIPVKSSQPVIIQEHYDYELECPILVIQTQTKVSQVCIDTEDDFNSYVDSLVCIFG